MRAIKLDAQTDTFSEIQIVDWQDIQKELAYDGEEPVFFEAGYFTIGDVNVTVYVDEEGMFKEDKVTPETVNVLCNSITFDEEIAGTPLAGNMIFSMINSEGETIDCDIDIDEIKKRVYPYDIFWRSHYDLENFTLVEM